MTSKSLKAVGGVAIAAVLALGTPALAQDSEAEEPVDPRAQDMGWHSQQQLYLLTLAPADGWHFEQGGVRWRWLEYRASERKPTVADTVTVHYEGRLLDGSVFDSSYERGQPATFPLGRLVPGWQIAIPKMGIGETIEIAIPSGLAYGAEGRGPIPPNATLIFKVELIGIDG